MSTTHHVKSWPKFFRPITAGIRTHELRRDDRGYAVGDTLVLHEYDPYTAKFTGAECTVRVTSITSDGEPCAVSADGLAEGFCILSIAVVATASPARRPQSSPPRSEGRTSV